MDLHECLREISSSMDAIEEQLNEATSNAEAAKNYADSAESEAYQAKEHAEYAESNCDEALSMLDTMRTEFAELQERIEEMERNAEGDDGEEKSPHLSDLQKDIAKHKVKVLKLKEKHPTATAQQIAANLKIGEFLVKRILEVEGKAA